MHWNFEMKVETTIKYEFLLISA